MRRLLLYVILFLVGLTGVAQKDSVRKYLDAEFRFTTKKNAVYAAMAIRSGDHWAFYAVYPDTTIMMKVYFKDAALTIKDGSFEIYYPKKMRSQSGSFKNNQPDGKWISWHRNGQLKSEGTLINNHFSGIWKTWYEDGKKESEQTYIYSDSTSVQFERSPLNNYQAVVTDFHPEGKLEGASTKWYENGRIESEVNYHNDSLAGVCTWYRPNGNPSSKETYVNGKVTELECFDMEGKFTGSTCSILKLPVLVHPFFNALDYIEYELHKAKLKDIKEEGEAEISFTITNKGKIEGLTIVSSPDAALSKHIKDIFAAMPEWSPAVVHNRQIDYTLKLVVPYYRD